ncbi:hypothetical protein PHLCEN_2v12526 [Hermanssonia centrifuga]|uniref:Uncharacterized protein n=1 Tax=Hermanssonia centrifuga TaxID=98765 RepID=A0A2R6NGU6_9APHY|nr:hypothetical protein PHLCEN_2v12526 [Hermanssonia centrifuga]
MSEYLCVMNVCKRSDDDVIQRPRKEIFDLRQPTGFRIRALYPVWERDYDYPGNAAEEKVTKETSKISEEMMEEMIYEGQF